MRVRQRFDGPVPDSILAKRERNEDRARQMFPLAEKLTGDRPATAHRDRKIVELVPDGVRRRVDRIVTSGFESLREGVDYSRKTGSMFAPGAGVDYSRSVVVDLDAPTIVCGFPIDSIKLKGASFGLGKLDKTFDLWRAQAELMGRRVSPFFVRMDFHFTPEGVVSAIPHVNEPLGAEFLFETVGEAAAGRTMLDAGRLVDVPLWWYEYDEAIKPPSGVRLGVMATGRIRGSRANMGKAMHGLYEEYSGRIHANDRPAIAEWKTKTERLYSRYIQEVARLHAGGQGVFHESPHPGQFHILDGDLNRILVSDVGFSEPLAGMPYPQRIACMAHDLKSVLAYAAHYQQNPLAADFGFDFHKITFQYFTQVDDPTLQALKSQSQYGPNGRIRVEQVFQESGEQDKPLIEFKNNPLIKALTQQYPEKG